MTTIAQLHATYIKASGLELGPMTWIDEYLLGDWQRCGWTEDDLRLVIAHIQREYPKYALKMLRFSALIGNVVAFRERLAEAKATARNARPAPTQRQQVLAAVNRPEPEQDNVKSAPEVAEKLVKGWQELHRKTGL